jgi:hypothetical protein
MRRTRLRLGHGSGETIATQCSAISTQLIVSRGTGSRFPDLPGSIGMAKISRKRDVRQPMATKTALSASPVHQAFATAWRVSADSLYERRYRRFQSVEADGRGGTIGPGTRLQIQVTQRATTHSLSLSQLRRWVRSYRRLDLYVSTHTNLSDARRVLCRTASY